jgi:uncharacterized protein with HEPN domain
VSDGEDHLAALADTLHHLHRLLEAGRGHYDANEATRLAIQRLWIAGGECARRYCDSTGTDVGAEPRSSLWACRNFLAHHLPAEISNERVWAESVQDLPEHLASLARLGS